MRFVPHVTHLAVRLPDRQIPHYYSATVRSAVDEGGIGGVEVDLLNGFMTGENTLGMVGNVDIPKQAVTLVVLRR